MKEHIFLLHGLWMRGFTLATLRRRLEHAGFEVELFDYASVMRDPELSVAQLVRRAEGLKSKKIHFVGHSLGGLIALKALRDQADLHGGRVVCMGTPLRGSAVARTIASYPGGSFVIGRSTGILSAGIERWSGPQEVGVIAGKLPIGLGFIVGSLESPHDGTVSVAETELPGVTDHCVVPATHLGLVFSDQAATQTVSFLRTARFAHAS